MVKIDWRNIDWDNIFKNTCEVLWLGFVAVLIMAIAVAFVILVWSIPGPLKILIFSVITVIVIFGSILRFGFGVRDR